MAVMSQQYNVHRMWLLLPLFVLLAAGRWLSQSPYGPTATQAGRPADPPQCSAVFLPGRQRLRWGSGHVQQACAAAHSKGHRTPQALHHIPALQGCGICWWHLGCCCCCPETLLSGPHAKVRLALQLPNMQPIVQSGVNVADSSSPLVTPEYSHMLHFTAVE